MRGKKRILGLFTGLIIIGVSVTVGYFYWHQSPKDMAMESVDTFYSYEQEGAFSDSWAMFHPQMKEKIAKVDYLQDRPDMLFNNFGVETFTYTRGKAEKIQNWTMEPGAERIDVVYKVTVTQRFQGKYGNFDIDQDVYTTEEDGEWMILWDYGGR